MFQAVFSVDTRVDHFPAGGDVLTNPVHVVIAASAVRDGVAQTDEHLIGLVGRVFFFQLVVRQKPNPGGGGWCGAGAQ